MAHITWWVTERGGTPVGPVSTELVVEGIARGMVPLSALVCPVGGTNWNEIGVEPAFRAAALARRAERTGETERTVMDFGLPPSEPPPSGSQPPPLHTFDETSEHTIAQPTKFLEDVLNPSIAPQPFDGTEERTVVDAALSDRPTLRKGT